MAIKASKMNVRGGPPTPGKVSLTGIVKPAKPQPASTKVKKKVKFPDEKPVAVVPKAAKLLLDETRQSLKEHKDPEQDGTVSEQNVSVFEKKLIRIKNSAIRHDWGEQTQKLVLGSMLTMLMDLIPVAERAYRKNSHHLAAYALTNYLNAVREVSNDMRAISSLGEQLNEIINIVRQQFVPIAQESIDNLYRIRKELTADADEKTKKKINERLEEYGRLQARYLNESLKMLQESLGEFLLEKPTKKTKE